jgi:uncharacterized Ntn-hydrolase superfamily protein
MSLYTRIGREGVELAIEVRSKLEDALKAMPDQTMSPEDIRNGLKNRGVQDLEIKQSGVDHNLKAEETYTGTPEDRVYSLGDTFTNPRRILEHLQEEGRIDRYTTHEIKGTLVGGNQTVLNQAEWTDLLQGQDRFRTDVPLTRHNLELMRNDVIDDINDLARNRELYTDPNAMQTQWNERLERINRLEQNFHENDMELSSLQESWSELAYDLGDDDLAELTPANIQNFIEHARSNIEDAARNGDDEYMDATVEAMEDRINQAEDILARYRNITANTGGRETQTDILQEYGLSENQIQYFEANQHLEQFAEIVEQIQGKENAMQFYRRMIAADPQRQRYRELAEKYNFDGLPYDANGQRDLRDAMSEVLAEEHSFANEPRLLEDPDYYNTVRQELEEVSRMEVPLAPTYTTEANEQFRALVYEIGDNARDTGLDTDELVARDAGWYLYNLEEGLREGRIIPGEDITLDQLNRVRDFANEPRSNSFGNIAERYTFDNEAYWQYTIPNTDAASYRVRLYKNPAVDTKGYRYNAHWQGDKIQNVIFHTRGDSPQPNAWRIQEIQSDIQNVMTSQRNHAIKKWRNADEKKLTAQQIRQVRNESDFYNYDQDAAIKLRQGMIQDWLIETSNKSGMDLYTHADSVLDLKEATPDDVRFRLAQDFFEDIDPLAPGVSVFRHSLVRGNLERGAEAIDAAWPAIKEAWPEQTDDELMAVIEALYNFKEDMLVRSEKAALEHNAQAALKKQLRVSPQERLQRVLYEPDATPEEVALRSRALYESTEGIAEKYDINMEGLLDVISEHEYPVDALRRAMLDKYVTEEMGRNSLAELATEISEHVGNLETDFSPRAYYKIEHEINKGSEAGVEFVRSYFEHPIPDINDAIEEINKKFIANVKTGMKDLTPLEKFPNAEDYNLPVPFIKQGIQEEVLTAIKEGKDEVWLTVNPPGVQKLVRGERPQKNYENGGAINKTFRTVAKRFKATVIEEDGYLKMKLPTKVAAGGGGVLAVSAYADTNTQENIQASRDAGYTDEEIRAFMDEQGIVEYENPLKAEEAINQGYTPEEIRQFEQEQFINAMDASEFAEHPGIPSDLPTIDGSTRYDKLPEETIRSIAIELEVDPSTPSGIDAIYEEAIYRKDPEYRAAIQEQANQYILEQEQAVIADLIELNDFYQPIKRLRAFFGDETAHEIYKANKERIQQGIMEMAQERGIDLILGRGQTIGDPPRELPEDEWFVNINGTIYNAEPGFLAMVAREGGEIAGSIAGGMQVANWTRGWDATPYTRLARFGAITAGVMAGAIIGDQVDYLAAGVRQDEEYNWNVAKDKALGSAQLSVLSEIGGLAVIKGLASGWRGVMRAARMAANGNINGAYDMLLRSLDVTDEQAREIVARWEDINQRQAPTMADKRKWYNPRTYIGDPEKEKAIAILPVTRAGGENIIPALAEKNPRASAAIASEINQRAKSLVRAAGEGLDRREAAQSVIDGINAYKANVQDYYAVVKQQGGELAPTGYQFNMDDLAVKPLVESLISKIYRDTSRKTAMNMLKRIDDLTNSRTFEDLIELRQLINDIRGRGKPNQAEIEAFQNVIDGIDQEIELTSYRMGPAGKQWHKDWLQARADYSEMKKLTNNALAKVVKREGVNENVIAKALVKYGTALDGTYSDLLKQLPLDVQPKVEALVVDELVAKMTDGNITQFQATNFPELSKALADYDFIWPRARALRDVVDKFAEIYQNDNALSYVSGGISTTKFQSYLTVDPVVRAQFEIASGFFNQIKVLLSGPKGDAAALIKASAKLLEDPLNPHNVEEALRVVGDDAALQQAIRKLSQETAQANHYNKPGRTTNIKMYKDGSGKLWTKPGEGRTEADSIPMHRITNEEVAKTISQAEDLNNLSTVEKTRLLNAGFTSVGLNDGSVIILN